MISSQGCRLFFSKRELIRLWNSILPEPGQPSAQLSKLICLTACKKTKHTVSLWYRIVYIRWLVSSYDTHKGKRWLNSDPPKPQGSNPWFMHPPPRPNPHRPSPIAHPTPAPTPSISTPPHSSHNTLNKLREFLRGKNLHLIMSWIFSEVIMNANKVIL